MPILRRSLEVLGRHGTLAMAGSIFLGLFVPGLATLFRPLLPVSVVLLLAITVMRVERGSLNALAARPGPAIAGLIWILILTPVLIGAGLHASGIAAAYPYLTLTLVLWATSPPIASGPALSLLIGLDHTLSLVMLVIAVLLIPLVTPLMSDLLLDQPLPIDAASLMMRLVILIGSAGILGMAGRYIIGMDRVRRTGGVLDGLSVLAIALFAFAIMDGILERILSDFGHVLALTALAFTVNLALLALTTVLFWRTGRRTAATIGFSTGNRNMALVISALGTSVPGDTWLFFVLVQFPIYLLPAMLKPIYQRMLAREPVKSLIR